jgi:aryl-alcohol dehydrogenase-like predicted oxidoreductase
MASKPKHPPLHTVLPPLILGTATFNSQYVSDPHSMPSTSIVKRAIDLGITAFDTSPYYGPSETLLGAALANVLPPRSALTLITKVGRIGASTFDYSAAQVRYSVLRSLKRLNDTPYLDLVYAHDVEFVTPEEVLTAVRELRRLRDEDGLVRYVGISGFPVDKLVELAEMVKRETGEGVDAVLSYGHFTLQNRILAKEELEGRAARESYLQRFKQAGVDVVLNASILGMGLLTTAGIPPDPETPVVVKAEEGTVKTKSPLAKWHPSPPELRVACKKLVTWADRADERLETVAIRWSLAEWARIGAEVGVGVLLSPEGAEVGATVIGVTNVRELEETVAEWNGVLDLVGPYTELEKENTEQGARQSGILRLVEGAMWPTLGEQWLDYAWASPGDDFENQLKEADRGLVPQDDGILAGYEEAKRRAKQDAEGKAGSS